MKVYLITAGSYSDHHVCGIFSTKEAAEAVLDLFEDSPSVEEYELDLFRPHPEGWKPWGVWMGLNGTIACKQDITGFEEIVCDSAHADDGIRVFLWAKDEDHAIKVASERRARWIAEAPLRKAAEKASE
jgi:hypothetical protein